MKALFVVACAGLFACSAASEPGDERAPSITLTPHAGANEAPSDPAAPAAPAAKEDGRRGHARATRDEPSLGLPATAPTPFVCLEGAFCEDFEAAPEVPFEARWSSIVRNGGGKMELTSDSASMGRGALTLFTPDAGSSVFLEEQPKRGVAGSWSGLVGFAFRVAQVPAAQLGGPELSVKTVDGPIAIRVVLTAAGLVLEQSAPASCSSKRCQPSATVLAPAKEGQWYRVRLAFEVKAQNAPPYGLIEATVDGGGTTTSRDVALDVPLYEGSVAFRAGITQGDTRRALATLDDVTLLLH